MLSSILRSLFKPRPSVRISEKGRRLLENAELSDAVVKSLSENPLRVGESREIMGVTIKNLGGISIGTNTPINNNQK